MKKYVLLTAGLTISTAQCAEAPLDTGSWKSTLAQALPYVVAGVMLWGGYNWWQLKKLERWLSAPERWSYWFYEHAADVNFSDQLEEAVARNYPEAYALSSFLAYQLLLRDMGTELQRWSEYRQWSLWAYTWNCQRILNAQLVTQIEERARLIITFRESFLHLFVQNPVATS